MRVNYHTSTTVWLHLEDYYNAGITPEEAKEIIEDFSDLAGNYLWCEPSGYNGNWHINVREGVDVVALIVAIEMRLEGRLLRKKAKA